MDFEPTPEQRKRIAEMRERASERFAVPAAGRASWTAAAELGVTGLCLPPEHGGGGLGALDTALCLEAFGYGCASAGHAFAFAAHLLACGVTIRDHAQPEARDGLLTGLASAELIAANAMTEDGAGSDVSRPAATAVRDGDHYVLDGVKSFVSNAPQADIFVTYATTDPAAGYLGVTAFAVPRDTPGLTVGEPMAKMGLDGCQAARVEFAGCRVPAGLRLGQEGRGGAIFRESMAWERACLPALYLGRMDRQLRLCVEHARERRQFGRPIGDFQAVSHRLAEMAQRLEAARLLLYRACAKLDGGTGIGTGTGDQAAAVAMAIAMSKTAVSEAAVANGLAAVQIFGGSGYLTVTGIEAGVRDAVGSTIFSGTTEIQKEIVARGLGL
ncbi:clorobiocin biosynthesis protein CloN3 [Sinosporangium album]|uniref:Clorobiocin biosynthesis protein CloN3 n=1 Tax=Sinosporangium album TaxID=504805 RepID=A0A1G7ZEB3_9ACTN|nr:acyl-CoA dehydrogenase family protein [Sinosporangium album]SDH06876.1 clorobiocin biosynthesis protein CloN3 [Sinosporangium album]